MIYRYACVSAQAQNLDTQIEQIPKYKINKIIKNQWCKSRKKELDDLLS